MSSKQLDWTAPRRFLGQLSPEQFLTRHWQKAPLLVRGALTRTQISAFARSVTRRTLQSLAQQPDVEARLVSVQGETWDLQRGPLERAQLSELGPRDWTVLVSDLEQHVPKVSSLLDELDFLPSWRVDDVMASFAVAGGSVGPHFDSYDVFLLQVAGQRRWQIAEKFDRNRVRDDTPLCILSEFQTEHEWLLEPGDLLYLPPKVAHYGVAQGDAITFSLGCRAPSLKELATQFAMLAIDRCPSGPLALQRPRRGQARHSLDPRHSSDVRAALQGVFEFDADACLRGLSSLVSQPRALFSLEAEAPPSAQTVRRRLAGKQSLTRRMGSRWLLAPGARPKYLYVDGEEYACADAAELALLLAQSRSLPAARARRALRASGECSLLTALVAAGQLVILRGASKALRGGTRAPKALRGGTRAPKALC